MSAAACCRLSAHGSPRVRRGAELAGWIASGVTLVVLPKCPACLAAYLALFSGVRVSIGAAANLRTSLLILCASGLVCLTLYRVFRLISARRA